jgi:hypothetical protein
MEKPSRSPPPESSRPPSNALAPGLRLHPPHRGCSSDSTTAPAAIHINFRPRMNNTTLPLRVLFAIDAPASNLYPHPWRYTEQTHENRHHRR